MVIKTCVCVCNLIINKKLYLTPYKTPLGKVTLFVFILGKYIIVVEEEEKRNLLRYGLY
jgi:hypothetical protein